MMMLIFLLLGFSCSAQNVYRINNGIREPFPSAYIDIRENRITVYDLNLNVATPVYIIQRNEPTYQFNQFNQFEQLPIKTEEFKFPEWKRFEWPQQSQPIYNPPVFIKYK